jgi:hypothetical protein
MYLRIIEVKNKGCGVRPPLSLEAQAATKNINHFKYKIMGIDEQIKQVMHELNCSRLKAIANMSLGERSNAANRVLQKRERRRELVEDYSLSFETACFVVDKEWALI